MRVFSEREVRGVAAVLGILWLLGGSACIKNRGTLTANGFSHEAYPYRVTSADGGVLDSHWRLDNFRRMADGRFVQKDDAEYLSSFRLDWDDDGRSEELVEQPTFDLRYEHHERGGVIWLSTFPISGTQSRKELRVLMQTFVDQIAGAGYERVGLDEQVLERRYAAEVLERGTAVLAGSDAYLATVDVANIDQIRVSPSKRATRVRLVIARPGFTYRSGGKKDGRLFPVLLVAGYSNLPEDFDRDLPSFERLLGAIEVSGGRGWKVATVEKLAPGPAAPAATLADPAPVTPAAAPASAPE